MSKLNSPLSIGELRLKNRLVLPPMATSKCGDDGLVTDDLCRYYDEKTKGGLIGLVITEHCFIAPEGKAGAGQMSIATDDLIPGLKKLTDTIHANGSPVIAQINHAGISAKTEITGLPVIGPSSVPHPTRPAPDILPVEMTLEDIERIKDAFVKAALRAKEAGFDGVEIHSAHSYLLNQFYSPLTNHRTDAYGGSLGNRIRLHIEIIKAVREAVGKSYIIAIRLGGCDYMEGGSTIEDAAKACKAFAEAGADLLDISGGFCSYRHPTNTEPGYFKDMTLAVMTACPDTPVILTGGITSGEQAEALLLEGAADLIGVGRAILQDSNWAFANMFRPLIRSHLALSQEESIELLKNERRGVLSVSGDNGYPYGMPMNHFYNEEDGHIYFHGGMEGHKIDAVKQYDKASFCVMDAGTPAPNSWALIVKSVIVFGRIKPVEDHEKAMEISRKLCYKFTDDEEYINGEIERSGFRTLCFELIPDHISGKRVLES